MRKHVRVSEILSRLQDFTSIDAAVLEAKAEIGTNVHNAIVQDATGQFPELNSDREAAYFESYRIWKEKHKPCYSMMESRFNCDNLMITGQIDALLKPESDTELPILIDYKTSAIPNVKIWTMQAHFYWYLLSENSIPAADIMFWINLRHKKIPLIDDNGDPILDIMEKQSFTYQELPPKVVEIHYDEKVLQECIQEAIRYWEEKDNAYTLDS